MTETFVLAEDTTRDEAESLLDDLARQASDDYDIVSFNEEADGRVTVVVEWDTNKQVATLNTRAACTDIDKEEMAQALEEVGYEVEWIGEGYAKVIRDVKYDEQGECKPRYWRGRDEHLDEDGNWLNE